VGKDNRSERACQSKDSAISFSRWKPDWKHKKIIARNAKKNLYIYMR